MANPRRVRVRVTGRVQGVFFRADCAARARRLGLAGTVRNSMDGSVEATFEGDASAVASMVGWCRTGPPAARVDAVDVSEEEPTGATRFEIQ